jgi:hypothetical protein
MTAGTIPFHSKMRTDGFKPMFAATDLSEELERCAKIFHEIFGAR